ncbi:MAG: tyrosine-type recombinase/integrase [Oscillibacter sp.]|nr:tyrosine-type recombinase/integrase [Oscillibacter sp.]
MAITERKVKNKRNSAGELTGKPGTVYDVNIKYRADGTAKTYSRKGFPTKKEALKHEAEMKAKLTNPSYTPPTAAQRKQTVQEYMTEWLERHGEANLRPSTKAGYQNNMKNHIFPYIGNVFLNQLSPAMLDDLYRQLSEKGLSPTSVKYVHRVLSVSLEHARKYHYISSNPAKDILTRFGKQGKTPEPYTIEQMRSLLTDVAGTPWELVVVLGGLYGLRMSEILGLRWRNVDLENGAFSVVEQLPFRLPASTTTIMEMAPVKSGERTLPITEITRPYFERQLALQAEQKQRTISAGQTYYDNDLVIARANGTPEGRERLSSNFKKAIERMDMPHIRFHDLRHSAATNIHQLTGDFYTAGQILGHSLKGIGIQLQLSTNLEAVTAQYVNVRLDRKLVVLDTYHEAVLMGSDPQ